MHEERHRPSEAPAGSDGDQTLDEIDEGELNLADLQLLDLDTPAAPPAASAPPPPPRGSLRPRSAEPKSFELRVPDADPAPRSARPAPVPVRPLPAEDLAPPDLPAFDTSDDSTEQFIRLCEAQLDQRPPPDRSARLHHAIGRIHELEAGDPQKAAEHYQAALRSAPDHLLSLRGARRVLAQLDRHPALPALFDAELKLTREPQRRAELLYEKATVLETHLHQHPKALEAYREALSLAPSSLVILKAVERALARDKQHQGLAQTYGDLASAVDDPSLRAAWLAVRARITERHLKDPAEAAALYQSALDLDPRATEALAALKRLAAEQQRWPLLVQALRLEYELCTDDNARIDLLASMARHQEELLDDPTAALDTLQAAVALRPHDTHLLDWLARIYLSLARVAEAIAVFAQLVEHLRDRDAQVALCHRIGHLYETQLNDPAQARPWYERALSLDPAHRGAADGLSAIHEAEDRWDAVVAVLAARADAIADPAERADLHHRVGTLLEQRLERPEAAAQHHARALGLNPEHPAAFDDLTRLYTATQAWHELSELYERAVDRAPSDTVAIAWLFRLGALFEDRLADARAALAAYERVLERSPSHLGALHAVQRAANTVGDHARVVDALRVESGLVHDQERRVALLHRAAEITADALEDPDRAIRELTDLLARSPKHGATIQTLIRLHQKAGRWDDLAGALKRLLALQTSDQAKLQLHFRLGQLAENHLTKDAQAAQSYRACLELDPHFTPALSALDDLLERTERFEELASALEKHLHHVSDVKDRARLATRLGQILEERLQQPGQALEAYRTAIAAVPLHRPALDARERLLSEQGKWKDLAAALAAEAEATEDPFLKVGAALRSALVLSERQSSASAALDAYRPVFMNAPDHVGALLAVEQLYARTQDLEGLAATYDKMSEVTEDKKAQLALLEELARIREQLGEDSASVHAQILQLAPNHGGALAASARYAAARDDVPMLTRAHARLAAEAPDAQTAAEHNTRLGEIAHENGDPGSAVRAFRAALEQDGHSLSATRGLTRAARASEDPHALRLAAAYERRVTEDLRLSVELLLSSGAIRQQAQDLRAAADDYREALDIDPSHPAAADGTERVLVHLGQIADAIQLLHRAAHRTEDPARQVALHLRVAALQALHQQDLGAAVAASHRALASRPEDPTALHALSEYLEQNGQWNEAASALERLLPKVKDEDLIAAHLRLAHLAEHHLDDPARAMRSLRAVLARDESRAEALAPLVRLERARGRDEEALRLAHRLIEVVEDEGQRAKALAELAQLQRSRNEFTEAAAAAYQAIAVQGPGGVAATVYRELVGQAPGSATWDHYTTALEAYLARTEDPHEVSETHRELARVCAEGQNRPDRALHRLREGVQRCPADVELSLALVRQLGALKAHDKALDEARRMLAYDVHQPRLWRAAADQIRALGQPGGPAAAYLPLVVIGQATADELRIARGRKPRPGAGPAQILGHAGLEQLVDAPVLSQTGTRFLLAINELIPKLEPPNLERYGVSRRDRLRPGDPHPVRASIDRVAALFAPADFDVYLHRASAADIAIELTSPPALMVPAGLEQSGPETFAFRVARPLSLLSAGLHTLEDMDAVQLRRLFVATVRQFDPSFSLGAGDPAVEGEVRRLARVLPWLSRGRIHEAAVAFVERPPADLEGYLRSVRTLALRAALLVSDDLLAALRALDEPIGPDNASTDLLRFWVSDPATRYRRAASQQL